VLLAYWRAKAVSADDATAGLGWWRALLGRQDLPRPYVHEAALTLSTAGDTSCALLAARTRRDAQEACTAYSGLSEVDLRPPTRLLDESVAVLDAAGSEAERAETVVGLLVAAFRRGASGLDVLDLLDACWVRIEPSLSETALLFLLEALAESLALDSRWPSRLIRFLTEPRGGPLRGALLAWCGGVLERGSRITVEDTDRIALGLCGVEQAQPMPRAVFRHLWDWALQRQRPDVVRSLVSLALPPETEALRLSLLEGLMAHLLSLRSERRKNGTP
jgi:hypothetical protein